MIYNEKLVESERESILTRIREAPQVPTNPNMTTSRIVDAARRALSRAGYDPKMLDD